MIRVVVAGTSAFGLPSFEVVAADQATEVVGVVTQPARPVGRHQVMTPTPVAGWAAEKKLPLLAPVNWKSETDLAVLSAWQPDIILVAAYGVIVPRSFLDIPKHGCLNLHASLLPAYRGASPITATILNGDTTTGITYMKMDEGLDTGPMLAQQPCVVKPDDTTPMLTSRLADLAATNIVAIIQGVVAGTIQGQPQPLEASYAKKVTRADGLADWESASKLERKTRAYLPWPGVWTTWHGTTLKFLAGQVHPTKPGVVPGEVISLGEGRWAVGCTEGVFEPTSIQFAGKQAQAAATVPGSYPGFIGSTLGS